MAKGYCSLAQKTLDKEEHSAVPAAVNGLLVTELRTVNCIGSEVVGSQYQITLAASPSKFVNII